MIPSSNSNRLNQLKKYLHPFLILNGVWFIGIVLISSLFSISSQQSQVYHDQLTHTQTYASSQQASLSAQLKIVTEELAIISASHSALANQDQRLINQQLENQISQVQSTYTKSLESYEKLIKFRELTTKTSKQDALYTKGISALSKKDFETALGIFTELNKDIETETAKIAAATVIPANIPINNSPPNSGYSRQQVSTSIGNYLVSLVSADLNSTKVIVDTASDSTCVNDCPVLALSDYVTRSGGFAGINGPYFCPATYPSCAGKKNSFDTLLMNKNKVYFNSDNNVYSTVPAVIFSGNSGRFVGKSLEWGRDTGVDAVIASQPMIVSGGNVAFGGDGDPKKGSKSARGFIGTTNNTVYIGHIHNATVAEAAHVVKTLGIQNALNLDGGGSVALWSGGYKIGPGRALPMAIVLVRK